MDDVELKRRLELLEARMSRIARRMCELHDEMNELREWIGLVERGV